MISPREQRIKTIYNGFVLNDTQHACENVRDILNGIRNTVCINSDQYFDIRVILSELLQNAIKHGNESKSQRRVHMKVFIRDEGILNIIVKDQGSGFNAHKTLQEEQDRQKYDIPDLLECGRGLHIVNSLCDDMFFNRSGNRITVLKRLN